MQHDNNPITIKVSDTVLRNLEGIGNALSIPIEYVSSMIVDSIFGYTYLNNLKNHHRLSLRKKLNVPCVVKLSDNNKNVTYKSASIIDISVFGVGVVIHGARFQVQSATPSPWVLASSKKTS